MSTNPENESEATGDFTPTSPERASAPPPSGDPQTEATADLPPSHAPTGGLGSRGGDPTEPTTDIPPSRSNPTRAAVSDRTDGHEATGEYTPGGSPVASRAADGTCTPVRANRYVLKKFHARGGMGEIWLAEDCDVGRAVALKKMRRKGTLEEQERFLREARITGQLEHPGIVPMHELGADEDGHPIYVMKFIHGKTLGDAIKEYHEGKNSDVPREVQLLRLLEVFGVLCQTIAYAHSRGVLHRDIKPDNVMLGPYGETLVLDWGLAKLIGQAEVDAGGRSVTLSMSGESVDESVAGSVRGTPGYMAPEMAGGLVQDVDALSDVYLLGATLYHILTGRKPRSGRNMVEILRDATTKPPVPPRKHDPRIPKALEAICLKAMALAKADRYSSAAALAEDVQRYMAGEPVLAYPEGFLTRAKRWVRKHLDALGRAAAVLAILGTVLAAVLIVRSEMQKKRAAEQQADAEKTQRENEQKARDNLARFRRLTDDSRYYLASAVPATDRTPYYDLNRGISTGRDALTVADTLAELPISDKERSEVAEQQYNLLLLLAQVQVRSGPDGARAGLDDLAKAEKLRSPSPGLHRLRAVCYRRLNDSRADEEQKQAEHSTTPQSAIDLFLLGEQDRAGALQRPAKRDIYTTWAPDQKALKTARDEFRAALRLDPSDFWANYHVGLCDVSLGENIEAVGAFDACVALHPDSVWAYVARGSALAQISRTKDALEDLTKALALDPDLLPARLSRGVVLMQQNKEEKYDEALADFELILAAPLEKRSSDAALYRAEIYRRRGKNDEALADLDRVASEDPKNRRVHRLRAAIHLNDGKEGLALDDLTAQLALDEPIDPNSKEAYEGRGHLLRLLSEDHPQLRKPALELALTQLDKAVDRGARSAKVFDEQGTTLDALGQYKEAIEKYTEALKEMPEDIKLLTKRGWAKVNSGDAALVIQTADDFAAAIHRDHAYPEAHTGLGYVAAERNDETLALREANLATLYAGNNYGVLHNASTIYAALSNGDTKRRKEYEDMTIDTLRRAVETWRERGKMNPSELFFIENEGAFQQHLKDRKEYQTVLEDARKP